MRVKGKGLLLLLLSASPGARTQKRCLAVGSCRSIEIRHYRGLKLAASGELLQNCPPDKPTVFAPVASIFGTCESMAGLKSKEICFTSQFSFV